VVKGSKRHVRAVGRGFTLSITHISAIVYGLGLFFSCATAVSAVVF